MPRPARPAVREELLDAARAEFARRGLEHARVEDIARRAGISKGAFYLHFGTKGDALHELVQRFLGALEDHAVRRREGEARLLKPGGDGREARSQAELTFETELLELLWRSRSVLVALAGAGDAPARELADTVRRRMHALVSRRIAERARAGALRADLDPAVLADVVVGAYEVLTRRMTASRRRPDLAGWARSLLLVLDAGMLVPPERRGRTPPAATRERR